MLRVPVVAECVRAMRLSKGRGPRLQCGEEPVGKLRALGGALEKWRDRVSRKLVLVRMDNAAVVAYANHGARRPGQMTRLARRTKESEIRYDCTAAALHIAGIDNAVRDASSWCSVGRPRVIRIPTWICGPGYERWLLTTAGLWMLV